MDEILEILVKHHDKYPLMQFEDVYKLIYQFCYGPKHMAMSKTKIYEMLVEESKLSTSKEPSFIYIGNNYYRVSLINNKEYILKLSEAFYNSIANTGIDLNINVVLSKYKKEICKVFNFDEASVEEKIQLLEKQKYPPISHSKVYSEVYKPHYRVVNKKFLSFLNK